MEIAKRQKVWVLTLPRPDASPEFDVVFRGKKGITLDVGEAVTFDSYVDALDYKVSLPTGEYYSPEPFDYHLGHQKERSESKG